MDYERLRGLTNTVRKRPGSPHRHLELEDRLELVVAHRAEGHRCHREAEVAGRLAVVGVVRWQEEEERSPMCDVCVSIIGFRATHCPVNEYGEDTEGKEEVQF